MSIFTFTPGPSEVERATSGVIMLQNSWTPSAFRTLSEDEFLSLDIRLATVLRRLL